LTKVNDGAHFSAELLLHTLHNRILSGSLTGSARAVSRSIADPFHRRVLRHASARKIQLHHAPTHAASLLCEEPPGLGTHAQIYNLLREWQTNVDLISCDLPFSASQQIGRSILSMCFKHRNERRTQLLERNALR